ncbi:MAG: TolC family protein [Bacteroidales bacterium]|nr:TolC family protein [Bacteroidales bacterium]
MDYSNFLGATASLQLNPIAPPAVITFDENKANAQLIQEKTQNLANAGMIEQTDAKKLSVMVASVENALKSTQRQVEFGYNLLRLQLGIDSEQEIKLSSTFDDVAKKYIKPALTDESFDIQNNQDFKLVSMQGEIAKKSIELKKASYLPSMAAFYSYTGKLKKPIYDISPKNVLGLTLNIPIFSSGLSSSQLNQARIDYDLSKNTQDLLTEQLTLQERQLRYNYNNLLEQYQSQQTNVEIAKEVLDNMKLKYQQGIISILELTSANNDYLNAESNYTSITLQLLNAEASLRKINSKL